MALLNILKAPMFRSFANYVPLVNNSCPLLTNTVASAVSKMNFSTTNALENIRNHFPRPSEFKRIQRHGWKKRMSTLAGRKVLMHRILKGRWVLSH